MRYYAKIVYRYRTPAEFTPGSFGSREFQRYRRFADTASITRRGSMRVAVLWFQTQERLDTFHQYLRNCKLVHGEEFSYSIEYDVVYKTYTLVSKTYTAGLTSS